MEGDEIWSRLLYVQFVTHVPSLVRFLKNMISSMKMQQPLQKSLQISLTVLNSYQDSLQHISLKSFYWSLKILPVIKVKILKLVLHIPLATTIKELDNFILRGVEL